MDYFLTEKRFNELKKELREFKTKKRIEVAEHLKSAKDLGDLSENSEYHEAREEQERIERRIIELDDLLKNAKIIKEGGDSADVIGVGSVVEITCEQKKQRFVIVGTNEAKPEDGYISSKSPLGKELIGKRKGDKVVVDAPSGKMAYKISKIGD